jgi:hypothetical protein
VPFGRIVLAAVAVASSAACAGGASPPPLHGGQPAAFRLAPGRVPRIVGGTAAERTLVRQIVRAQATTQILQLTIVPATGGVGLRATLAGTARRVRNDILGDWETWIVGGAFRDRSAALGLRRVVLIGNQNESGRATGGRDLPRRPPAGLAAFRRRVAAVAGPGARVVAVRVGDPDGYSAIVVLRVTDPASFLRHRLRGLELRLAGLRADGTFLVVDERNGRVLYSEGGSERLSSGVAGPADRRYRGCIPNQMTGLAMASPPPCPATG